MVTEEARTARILDALGHQARRDILVLLRDTAMPVGDIADRLPISRPAVSRHLRLLTEAGLVEFTASGTRNVFRLRADGFAAARAYLEGFWDEALTRFRHVAEDEAGQGR